MQNGYYSNFVRHLAPFTGGFLLCYNYSETKPCTMKHPFRETFMTRHHSVPISRMPHKEKLFLLRIWRDKHNAFHVLYRNLTFGEIIVLTKVNMKWGGTVLEKWYSARAWKALWGNKSKKQVYDILQRTRKMKRRKKCQR
jgi:hypothetical protein